MNRADDRLLMHLEIFQVSPASHPWLCNFYNSLILGKGASQMAQRVKNTPAMQEMWVQSLGREDPPEEGMTTHSSILFKLMQSSEFTHYHIKTIHLVISEVL